MQSSSKQPGQRYNKACDSCHVSKVRCVPDPQSPTGTLCRRCSKNGVACVFSPVGPRRRPVRTKNERIAELERRVRDMQLKLEKEVEKRSGAPAPGTEPEPDDEEDEDDDEKRDSEAEGSGGYGKSSAATLSHSRSASSSTVDPPPPRREPGDASPSTRLTGLDPWPGMGFGPVTADINAKKATGETAGMAEQRKGGSEQPTDQPSSVASEDSDVVDRGVLTESQADRLVHEFRVHLNGKFVAISLPPGVNSRRLRREKPVFWLSVLCAAAGGSSHADLLALAPVLFGEMHVLLNGRLPEHSSQPPTIDLLQGLMNYTTFHYEAAFPLVQQLLGVFHAGVSMALSMAATSKLHMLPDVSSISEDDITDDDIQLSRELLRWYWFSLTVLLKSRQAQLPQTYMLRQSHLLEASYRILETTHNNSDLSLLQWINLVKVVVEAIRALYRGHTQTLGGLSGEARDEILMKFEKEWKKWLVECPFDLVNEQLMLEYHYLYLLVSEVIYPAGVADFTRRRHGLPSLDAAAATCTHPQDPSGNLFASYKLSYTRRCIKSAHACLELATKNTNSISETPNVYTTRTTPDTDLMRRFGVLPFGRMFYALRFLLLVAHEAWRTKSYEIVDVDSLRLQEYMDVLRDRLQAASAGGKYRLPSLWLYALKTRILPWYSKLRSLLAKDKPSPQPPPQDESSPASSKRTPASWPTSPVNTSQRPPLYDSSADHAGTNPPLSFSPLLFGYPFEMFPSPDPFPGHFHHHSNHSLDSLTNNMNASLFPGSATNAYQPVIPALGNEGNYQAPSQYQSTAPGSVDAADIAPPQPHSATVGSQLGDAAWAEYVELDPFAFNWGFLGEALPGSEVFQFSHVPFMQPNTEASHEAAEGDGGVDIGDVNKIGGEHGL